MEKYDLAIIAHDAKKEDLILLTRAYKEALAGLSLVATRNTGRMVQQGTGLPITLVQSTQEGGALQIGALVASGCVKAVVFLRDHVTVRCDEVDRQALLRVCDALNVPVATNTETARALLHFLCEEKAASKKKQSITRLTEALAGVY